jgi:hypothetical protein
MMGVGHFREQDWVYEAWRELAYYYSRTKTPLPQLFRRELKEMLELAEKRAPTEVGDPARATPDPKKWLVLSEGRVLDAGRIRVLLALEDGVAGALKAIALENATHEKLRAFFNKGDLDLEVRRLDAYAREYGFVPKKEEKAAA